MFKSNLHVNAFIKRMSSEQALKTFHPDMHVAVAEQVIKNAKAVERELSAEFIDNQLGLFIRDGKMFQARSVAEIKREQYQRDIRNKLTDLEKDIEKYTGLLSLSIQRYQEFLKENPDLKSEMDVNGIRLKFEDLSKNIKLIDAALLTEIGSWVYTETQNI